MYTFDLINSVGFATFHQQYGHTPVCARVQGTNLVYGDYIRLTDGLTMQKSSSHRMREFRTALLLALGLALVSLGGAVLASTFVSH